MSEGTNLYLGSGVYDGLEWELIVEPPTDGPPELPRMLSLRCGGKTQGAGWSEPPFSGFGTGGWGGFGSRDHEVFFVFGQLSAEYSSVTVTCTNGEEVEALVIDAEEWLGHHAYIAGLPKAPVRAVARGPRSQQVGIEFDIAEMRQRLGWPRD